MNKLLMITVIMLSGSLFAMEKTEQKATVADETSQLLSKRAPIVYQFPKSNYTNKQLVRMAQRLKELKTLKKQGKLSPQESEELTTLNGKFFFTTIK